MSRRSGSDKKEAKFVNIGSVLDKGTGSFIAINSNDFKSKSGKEYKAPGRILFEDYETGQIYEVNTVSIFNPNEKAPEMVLNNLVINLLNEKQCKDVTKDFDA